MSKTIQSNTYRKPSGTVTKPIITLKAPGNNRFFDIYVYEAGQSCKVAEGATMQFGACIGSKTGGIVYVVRDNNGVNATDYNLTNQSVWDWIKEHMQVGLDTLNPGN